jgi:hypothetical protein
MFQKNWAPESGEPADWPPFGDPCSTFPPPYYGRSVQGCYGNEEISLPLKTHSGSRQTSEIEWILVSAELRPELFDLP